MIARVLLRWHKLENVIAHAHTHSETTTTKQDRKEKTCEVQCTRHTPNSSQICYITCTFHHAFHFGRG